MIVPEPSPLPFWVTIEISTTLGWNCAATASRCALTLAPDDPDRLREGAPVEVALLLPICQAATSPMPMSSTSPTARATLARVLRPRDVRLGGTGFSPCEDGPESSFEDFIPLTLLNGASPLSLD